MTATLQISPSSVFVVSGGAKGITAQCTIKLAQNQPCKFILLGRSEITTEPEYTRDCLDDSALKKRIMENLISQGEKPTPMMVQKIFNEINSSREIKKTLEAIAAAGAKAEYISVDVTDTVALQEKLNTVSQKLGQITGIIHGAGNLADKLIEKKTQEDFDKVYNAKVQGLQNLLSCVHPQQLQHLVLFSSVTGFYGNIGQSDYAIANEILNKSAHQIKQNYPQCHVVAINWGGWDSGMVTPQLKKAFAERGISIIPLEVGTQMLVNELYPAYQDNTQIVIGSTMIPPAMPLGSELRSYRIRRRMTLAENPFLYDHTIAGSPVLPATCAKSWMVNGCEEIYPGYTYFSCQDFKVLKGITFNSTLANEHILEIQEVAKSEGDFVEFQTKILSKTPEGRTLYHFSSLIKLVKNMPEAPIYESMDLREDNIVTTTGKGFYQNGDLSLFHGPAFQEITRILNISSEKLTAECCWQEISAKQQGQFPVKWHNPYIIDLSTQTLWLWLNHVHQEVCLPGQLTYCEQYLAVPFNIPFYVSCEVKAKTDTGATVNFIIHNREGKIYSRILGAKAVIWPMKTLNKK
ncbi:SDR family NAD(P)-dependent oxidoreductase [Anabaena cylindrica FACHB-243]|uniref:KR domain protein n=1 Tax=Anabaena cylindrica (strain ATCC 27899 / PCC 7122) TaxID=272123 RepID=K9ZJ18_ANACC|nr:MULTISPECIES: SDR family NAD(P)-dependent oxidoreductase [Anabaena]AFZ58562.1 KR domain protein [Anabaena cylindrica PCC 7122]MBD2416324.1 SDR family NAD(P)-dependent oxidoreductase [Anabaena cylindrica FACHB-243]MBY5283906.1 SDR family NAD(P)-dependent oxidoreductase [Anabaena sp. CCAP 1446/1C]MBY5306718.1 SDR family NAD(P)-dependent oxidoreductase [Anabaena sp. CCAP 1446/1C]MCM2407295.1 SDR family NAD(P)-dependent oxidoreductase [Anabaena sp. CCAP 1446/1C]